MTSFGEERTRTVQLISLEISKAAVMPLKASRVLKLRY